MKFCAGWFESGQLPKRLSLLKRGCRWQASQGPKPTCSWNLPQASEAGNLSRYRLVPSCDNTILVEAFVRFSFLALAVSISFYPFLVLNLWEKGKARPEQDIVSELAITEVLLRPKSLSHKFLSTDPRTGLSGLNKFLGKGASHLVLFCICCQFIFHSISWCSV